MKKFMIILLVSCNLLALPAYNIDTLNRINPIRIEV